jgi:acyl-CoA dehydrogenase
MATPITARDGDGRVDDGIDRDALRASLATFVAREVTPHLERWEADGGLPRALYAKAGALGLLGLGFPEDYGGVPCTHRTTVTVIEALAAAGSGGLIAGLLSHGIALPAIVAIGDDALCRRVLPEVLRGERIAALAVTEPSGGSDVANLRTSARRDGDDYVLRGAKTFITSGVSADWLTVAARTGGPGLGGVSLFAVPGDSAGLRRRPLEKMGWWCSDTAEIALEDVRVPASLRVGGEGEGFMALMANFNRERLMLAAMAVAFARVAVDDALDWARSRETFGRPLVARQLVRHKLVALETAVRAARAFLLETTDAVDLAAAAGDGGDAALVAEVCMVKNHCTAMLEQVAGEAVQLLGGMGYMRGVRVERIFRETKVLSIGGGASEVLAELAARQLGIG